MQTIRQRVLETHVSHVEVKEEMKRFSQNHRDEIEDHVETIGDDENVENQSKPQPNADEHANRDVMAGRKIAFEYFSQTIA